MKTEWDYSALADAYLERPEYAQDALDALTGIAGLQKGDRVCDIGAGVAHLTIPFLERGFLVDAVEPNDAMRANGKKRTTTYAGVQWFEGTGEATGCPDAAYDFVSFGSSFNVCDRKRALQETYRLLKPQKYFCCLWNHRDLDDPLQKSIEEMIASFIPNYGYGTRREDQTDVINASGLFFEVRNVAGKTMHRQSREKVVEAWRSHATLHRQAGEKFQEIIANIEKLLQAQSTELITIPYTTRAWIARKKD